MYRILLVEDDISISSVVANYLIVEGFTVHIVHNVQIALYYILLFKPNLIIVDIMMSNLNGLDFIKIVKLDYRFMCIPFVFLTAKGMTIDRITGYHLGCSLYLSKPFNPKELMAIIKNNIHDFTNLDIISNSNLICQNLRNNDRLYFSDREKVILQLVFQGYTNKEIAIQLNLGIRNIEKYITSLLTKTYSRNRTELVKIVLSLDYIFNL